MLRSISLNTSRFWALTVVLLSSALFIACTEETPAPDEPSSRPVKIFTVEGSDGSLLRRFPGRVEASQRAELGFRVAGTINEIAVKEGDNVAQGAELAKLDPTDFQIKVDDRTATFENAKRNFERAKELVGNGAISRLDFDEMDANFKTSKSALEAARQDLAYTVLKAPFAGQVARRYLDNFEEVQAKQSVFRLQNVDQLDVIIDLPESLIRSLSGGANTADRRRKHIPIYAEFEGRPGARFDLSVKEIATKADPDTQTFPIRLTMLSPKKFPVLPGMTANVTVDFGRIIQSASSIHLVPATAVVADSELSSQLWVLDPQAMTVSSRKVKVGAMTGDRIEVFDGVRGGEEIVSVGAAYLSEGMRVSRMQRSEQAVPRADDPS